MENVDKGRVQRVQMNVDCRLDDVGGMREYLQERGLEKRVLDLYFRLYINCLYGFWQVIGFLFFV